MMIERTGVLRFMGVELWEVVSKPSEFCKFAQELQAMLELVRLLALIFQHRFRLKCIH